MTIRLVVSDAVSRVAVVTIYLIVSDAIVVVACLAAYVVIMMDLQTHCNVINVINTVVILLIAYNIDACDVVLIRLAVYNIVSLLSSTLCTSLQWSFLPSLIFQVTVVICLAAYDIFVAKILLVISVLVFTPR